MYLMQYAQVPPHYLTPGLPSATAATSWPGGRVSWLLDDQAPALTYDRDADAVVKIKGSPRALGSLQEIPRLA